MQFWHCADELPHDVKECIASWEKWGRDGYVHLMFDRNGAEAFIGRSLGKHYKRAFGRCYHPAMQADYFRLCYLYVEGGFYVDADDICVSPDISDLFADSRLKVQPLCYDVLSGTMVKTSVFLRAESYEPSWIYYFNNNPLIADRNNPIIESALNEATRLLNLAHEDELLDIQATTGPGNLSKSIFGLGTALGCLDSELVVMRDWEQYAVSKWPLSYRNDARNWRLSNQQRFDRSGS